MSGTRDDLEECLRSGIRPGLDIDDTALALIGGGGWRLRCTDEYPSGGGTSAVAEILHRDGARLGLHRTAVGILKGERDGNGVLVRPQRDSCRDDNHADDDEQAYDDA